MEKQRFDVVLGILDRGRTWGVYNLTWEQVQRVLSGILAKERATFCVYNAGGWRAIFFAAA